MPEEIDDETTERVIELLNEGDLTQDEIADKAGVSQTSVSRINRGLSTGKKRGMKKGYKEGYKDAADFSKADDTEKPEDDYYWCEACKSETGEEVEVEYMAETCPNGHDLSGAW